MNPTNRFFHAAGLSWLVLTAAQAQLATAVSNLDNSATQFRAVGDVLGTSPPFSRAGADEAEFFTTGPTGTVLQEVTLAMHSGGIAGGGFTVSLYSDDGEGPGNPLATLSGEANPSATGRFTYVAAGGIPLAASTSYWIVASAPHTDPDKSYLWLGSSDFSETGLPGWSLGQASRLDFVDGAHGLWVSQPNVALQMGLIVGPVPEPQHLALAAGVGLACFAGWRRLRR